MLSILKDEKKCWPSIIVVNFWLDFGIVIELLTSRV